MENLKELIENNIIVVVDLETTGLDTNRDYIIEAGAVKIKNGKIIDKFSSFVNNPQLQSIPEEVAKLTGISYEQLETAPSAVDVLKRFYGFSKDCILVAHNLPFDFAFLRNWGFWCGICFDEFKNSAVDTVKIAREVLGEKVENYKLSTLAKYYGIKDIRHRALDDAEVTAKILLRLAAGNEYRYGIT